MIYLVSSSLHSLVLILYSLLTNDIFVQYDEEGDLTDSSGYASSTVLD